MWDLNVIVDLNNKAVEQFKAKAAGTQPKVATEANGEGQVILLPSARGAVSAAG